ncbi:hypothetical protein DNTS_022714 [Danionella cerebrum]|uniref:CD3 gamma/delta subunit Ig-like domain-containing protein n=1 Tax=Danionella cerebrum TaxID=2873325 RepID=A0A553MY08_9TELE|nr:hypothetical protein DNTS_022714 [Danionella translucida]
MSKQFLDRHGRTDIKVQGRVVTLACPYSTGDYSWKGSKNVTGDKEQYLTVTATQGQELFEGEFSCVNNDGVEHWFYFSVKVCDGCYEFDGLFAMGVIFGDLLLTGAVILIVFLCARKQTHSTPTHTQQRATNTRIMNPPRPPNPDYEVQVFLCSGSQNSPQRPICWHQQELEKESKSV